MQNDKGKRKVTPFVPPPMTPSRVDFLAAGELELLDGPSKRLHRMILRQPQDYNNWEYSDNHTLAFGYDGLCMIDLDSIKAIMLRDWLDASILKFYCM